MSAKIDYMHPLVLNVIDINIQLENIRSAKLELDKLQENLRDKFRTTLLYKELKSKYEAVRLVYIDEDITQISAFDKDGKREILELNTQEIADKLNVVEKK